jgi:hypothetical protein
VTYSQTCVRGLSQFEETKITPTHKGLVDSEMVVYVYGTVRHYVLKDSNFQILNNCFIFSINSKQSLLGTASVV